MRIRDATHTDRQGIRAVHVRSIRELGASAYSSEQVDAWAAGRESADYAAPVDAADTEYVVAVDDSEVVGFGSLTLTPPSEYERPTEAEITAVYVDPAVAREGVGTRIYEELERRARDADVDALGLTASRNAVPFYEAHGYERVTDRDHEFSSSEATGVTGTVVKMPKQL